MRTASYVVRVPRNEHGAFAVQVIVMRDAMKVWCGRAPCGIAAEPDDAELQSALAVSGRTADEEPRQVLASDWSVAMGMPQVRSGVLGVLTPVVHGHSPIEVRKRRVSRHVTATEWVIPLYTDADTQANGSRCASFNYRWTCPRL